MYRGFKILNFLLENSNLKIGEELYHAQKIKTIETIQHFISANGTLDGSKLQENWFPKVDSHIFISHSHYDKNYALALAGWLWTNFKLKSFIDSCIWGYADDLLKEIDKKYCFNPTTGGYNYENRNHSTSLVHMMLSSALSMMIDKTECLFFLSTPNSISASDIKNTSKTSSPWIYSEITISQLIHKQSPEEHRPHTRFFSKSQLINENKKFIDATFDLDLNHLAEINQNIQKRWLTSNLKFTEALDMLYELVPPPNK